MRLLISGSSLGIGRTVAEYFLSNGHEVIGIDIKPSSIDNPHYEHHLADVRFIEKLPELKDIDLIFVNAGIQNSGHDIDTNLKGAIHIVEKYAFHEGIRSVLFNASASARSGYEFPEYVASKAGIVGYMKNVACRLAQYGATVNSLSLGGVITDSNKPVMEDEESWKQIMAVTPLKKWMSEKEVAEWVYFLLVVNRSMSGQDVLVDNGEYDLNSTFVWPK